MEHVLLKHQTNCRNMLKAVWPIVVGSVAFGVALPVMYSSPS